MKTVVAVVIYDRKQNLERWMAVWQKAAIPDAELRIIHNLPPSHASGYAEMCVAAGVTYIPRLNQGMDIGAFQDVCRKRLKGFAHDFDYLLWCTDDTFPMRDSFVSEFVRPLEDPKIGVTCFEISPQVKPHIRTTGFCLRAETLEKIAFEANPIKTKDDCYRFEHRGTRTLLAQIQAMGMVPHQVSPVQTSPLWDSGGGGIKWPDREHEFQRYWKLGRPSATVLILAPAYGRYPSLVSSLIAQTYENWELHLIHDGPAPADFPRFADERVIFTETPRRRKEYGHPIRIDWLQQIKDGKIRGDYAVITNEDNYHAPVFLEKLVRPLEEDSGLVGAYCSQMVHNYKGPDGESPPAGQDHFTDGYGVLDTKPEIGFIDCAAVVVRAKVAGEAGWPSTRHSSDWDYLNNIAWRSGGWHKLKKVFGALLVHN